MGLEPLFSWLPELIGWVLSWIPRGGRLPVHEGGVKISGEKVTELTRGRHWSSLWLVPSWYWWVPKFTDVYVDNIKRKVVDLPEQLLTTSDRVRVRAGGIMVYHITNVVTWLVENEDPEHGLKADAARVLREWVKSKTFDEVQAFKPEKRGEDDLTRLAQAQLGTDFGVRVRQLALASFAECTAVDLHHNGLTDHKLAPIIAVAE